jgi:hypothetical protein
MQAGGRNDNRLIPFAARLEPDSIGVQIEWIGTQGSTGRNFAAAFFNHAGRNRVAEMTFGSERKVNAHAEA